MLGVVGHAGTERGRTGRGRARARCARPSTQGEPYDVAVLDMMMPEMDGEELGRRDQGRPELGGVHLVMMTSMGRRGDASRLEKVGFAAYLTKPVKQSQLFDCLVPWSLHRARTRPARGARSSPRHSSRRIARSARRASCWPRTTPSTRRWRSSIARAHRATAPSRWRDGQAALEALSTAAVRPRPHGRADARAWTASRPRERIRDQASAVLDHSRAHRRPDRSRHGRGPGGCLPPA